MFKRFLMPTDGSEHSQRAILAGVKFAQETGAAVHGLTVVPKPRSVAFPAEMVAETRVDSSEDDIRRGTEILQFIVGAANQAGVPCTTEQVVSDDPWKVITTTATDRQCDLIVMGSHGRGGVAGVLLGSETQKVLVHSRVPVLVYR